MNAIDLLTQQHAELDRLLQQLAVVEGEARELLFEELASRISAHALIEEKIFYPAVMVGQTAPTLALALEQHEELAQIVAELRELEGSGPELAAGLGRLARALAAHAHHAEETSLFPRVKETISPDRLDAMGAEMAILYDQLLEPTIPRARVAPVPDAAHGP
jgi:hemerythrin superfamily protein